MLWNDIGSNTTTTNLDLISSTVIDCGPHRVSSRSVSWNSNGAYLANASSDRTARVFSVDTATNTSNDAATGVPSAREVLVISHTAVVVKSKFHTTESTQLLTAAADKMIRLWDIRGATQRSTGKIELQCGTAPVTTEWGTANNPHNLIITERDGTIYVYDVRKLSASSNTCTSTTVASPGGRSSSGCAALYVLPNNNRFGFLPESCIFSPDGDYLLVDSYDENENGSVIRVYSWKKQQPPTKESISSFASHGPLYAMQFAPNNRRLATAGSDATVGIWDANDMACTHTVSRHTKFLRSVAFSHDSRILASSTEEDNIDIANSSNGELVGLASLTSSSSGQQRSSSSSNKLCGAEEIAFHPKDYLLACARTDGLMGPPSAPLTIIKLSISNATQ